MDKAIFLGKNYLEHSHEMNEAHPEKPVLFLKPPSVVQMLDEKKSIKLPWHKGPIHYECEIIFKVYKKNIIGISLGLDLTLRNLQKELKQKGHPWEISKVFSPSALIIPFLSIKDFRDWQTTSFEFSVNQKLKQSASLSEAVLKADEIIHYILEYFPLMDGDIIFSGTPQGVGELAPNDRLDFKWGPLQKTYQLSSL